MSRRIAAGRDTAAITNEKTALKAARATAQALWAKAYATRYGLKVLHECQRFMARAAENRELLQQARRAARSSQAVLRCLPKPRRLTAAELRSCVPESIKLEPALLQQAQRAGRFDEKALRLLRYSLEACIYDEHAQLSTQPPEQMYKLLDFQSDAEATFVELRTLWQGLRQLHFELLCAGVPLSPLAPLRDFPSAAALRVLGEQYRLAGLYYRQVQWRHATVQVPAALALSAAAGGPASGASGVCARGVCREYGLEDDCRVLLTGESAATVNYTPQLRTLTLHRGEMFCQLDPQLGWPFEIAVGAMRVQLQGGWFWVSHSAPGQVSWYGHGDAVCIRAGDRCPMYLRPAMLPLNTQHLLYGEAGLRVTRRQYSLRSVQDAAAGVLTFEYAPLAEVAHTLTRYSAHLQFECAAENSAFEVTATLDLRASLRVLFKQLRAAQVDCHLTKGVLTRIRLSRLDLSARAEHRARAAAGRSSADRTQCSG